MTPDFEPPPKGWTMLATVGGVVTAIALIVGLEWYSMQFQQATEPTPQFSPTSLPRRLRNSV